MATSRRCEADLWRDLQPDFRTSHYLDGFAHADKKFHFKADWAHPPLGHAGMGAWRRRCRRCPTTGPSSRRPTSAHPFRLATSPSRSFLNTSFNETPSSQAREGAPIVMIHPVDAAALGIADGDAVTLGNIRGETTLTAQLFDGRAPRRADRGIGSSEQGPYRRPRHQHADRRRGGGADRRRGVPRQQGLGQEGGSPSAQPLNRPCSLAADPAVNVRRHGKRGERFMTDNTASSSKSAGRRSGSPSTGRTSATRSMAT